MSKGSRQRRFKKKDSMDKRRETRDPEDTAIDTLDLEEDHADALDLEEDHADALDMEEDSTDTEDLEEEFLEEEEAEEKELVKKAPEKKPEKKTAEQKRMEKKDLHLKRVKRTLIACIMGLLTGILSYVVAGVPDAATGVQPNAFLPILLLLAGIVFQKHIFVFTGIDINELGKKDWFYQGFMTFALWFISWTVLLTKGFL